MTRTTRAGSLPAGLALPTLAALSLFLGGCPITKRPRHDAGLDAGRDADAPGLDAGPGPDAGEPERDAGSDAGTNTGDAGSPDIEVGWERVELVHFGAAVVPRPTGAPN